MSDDQTPRSPDILQQILAEIHGMKVSIADLGSHMDRMESRLERVEARQAEINKLDKLIGQIAGLQEEIKGMRRDIRRMDANFTNDHATVLYHDLRIERLEEQGKPKQ